MSQFELDDFLPYQLAVLASHVSTSFARIYGERFGLSVAEWRTLAQLGNALRPLSVRDVARLTELEKSKVSRAIERLKGRGFVAKAQSVDDKRLVAVQITASGREVITTLAPLAAKFEQDLLTALGPQADQFRQSLRKLLDQAG